MEINNVLIICHYAQQPPYNTMLRYHNWGKELIKKGYSVTILAASVVHNTDIDIIKQINAKESVVDGVKYKYIKTPKYKGNGLKRVLNMLSFCLKLLYTKKAKFSPDVIISSDAYIFPFVKRKFKKVPIIVDITDLWPLSIVEYAGVSNNNPIIKLLYRVEKKSYIKCDALIFSIEGGRDYVLEQKYSKKINLDKIFHINMGIDLNEFDKNKEKVKSDLIWNVSGFNVGYCGSIRQANHIRQICDAAKILMDKGYKDIQFQIYGNGDELDTLISYCDNEGISNVHFYGRIDRERNPFILSSTTANIITYKQVDLMRFGGSQSKLFDYFASGKPIICNAHFGYNLITRFNCGIETEKQEAESLAKSIEMLYKLDKKSLAEMGLNSRRVAENYDQPILVNKLIEVFDYITSQR